MSDTMKEYIAEAEKDLLHTYNRYPVSYTHLTLPTKA